MWPATSLLGICPNEMKSYVCTKIRAGMFMGYDSSIKRSDLVITHNSVDESQIHDTEWRKPRANGHAITFTWHSGGGKTAGTANSPMITRGQRERLAARAAGGNLSGWQHCPIAWLCSWLHICTLLSSPQNCIPERVKSTACKLDFKKTNGSKMWEGLKERMWTPAGQRAASPLRPERGARVYFGTWPLR